jgi:hypothetical protein
MKVLKIEAKPLEPIRLTDDTWQEWLRFAAAAIGMILSIEALCT